MTQFGSVKKNLEKLHKADFAVYSMTAAESLKASKGPILDKMLGGKSDFFVAADKIGAANLGPDSDAWSIVVDLKTMKILGIGTPKQMGADMAIKLCKDN